MSIEKTLWSEMGKEIVSYSGEIKPLQLDGLVIPCLPDLYPMQNSIIKQALFESEESSVLFGLGEHYTEQFTLQYGNSGTSSLPVLVPTKSSHILDGHNKKLAKKLIYSLALELDDSLNIVFNKEVIEETTKEALHVAEYNSIKTLGIAPLVGTMTSFTGINEIASQTISAHVIRDTLYEIIDNNKALEKVYLLFPEADKKYEPFFVSNK